MPRAKRKSKSAWFRYHQKITKLLAKADKHKIEVERRDWLEETQAWMKEKEFVTPTQMEAVERVETAIQNMIAYKKLIKKRRWHADFSGPA